MLQPKAQLYSRLIHLSEIEMLQPKAQPYSRRTGTELTIVCEFSGPRLPNIHWLKDEKYMSLGHLYLVKYMTSQTEDGVISVATLTKNKSVYDDAGIYTCIDEVSNVRKDVSVILGNMPF